MKKLSLVLALIALSFSLSAQAEENVLTLSGHGTVLTGFQQDTSDTPNAGLAGGMFALVRGPRASDRTTFNFYLDEFELDLEKSFGDRIRLRADIDFGRVLSGSQRVLEGADYGVMLEQAYVSLGIGDNWEFLIGRFNAPVGYYVVDRSENPTISFSNIYNFLTPTSVTGAKFYADWDISDKWGIDLHLYAMNQMFDCLQLGGDCLSGPGNVGDSAIPSWGLRLGFPLDLGTGEKDSTIGIAYMGGPEQTGSAGISTDPNLPSDTNANNNFDHLLDLDWNLIFPVGSHKATVAGELIYYVRDFIQPGFSSGSFFGALLVFDFDIGDTPWDAFLTYGYVNDSDEGFVTGLEQQIHNLALGFGYQLFDQGKFKFETRADYFIPDGDTQGFFTNLPGTLSQDLDNHWSFGAGVEFSYNF